MSVCVEFDSVSVSQRVAKRVRIGGKSNKTTENRMMCAQRLFMKLLKVDNFSCSLEASHCGKQLSIARYECQRRSIHSIPLSILSKMFSPALILSKTYGVRRTRGKYLFGRSSERNNGIACEHLVDKQKSRVNKAVHITFLPQVHIWVITISIGRQRSNILNRDLCEVGVCEINISEDTEVHDFDCLCRFVVEEIIDLILERVKLFIQKCRPQRYNALRVGPQT